MSGVATGIVKIFKSIGTGVAKLGSAIRGVGATLFTASAATGGSLGGLMGNGVLGSILGGAIKQGALGALIGGTISAATGHGFGKGALYGGLAGAAVGGLSGAAGGGLFSSAGLTTGDTATGLAATGSTSGAALPTSAPAQVAIGGAPAAPAVGGGGFGKFLQSEAAGGLLAGVGQGIMGYAQAKSQEEQAQADRDFVRAKEQRITDSYSVPDSVFAGNTGAATVAATAAASKPPEKWRYEYSPQAKNVIRVPA